MRRLGAGSIGPVLVAAVAAGGVAAAVFTPTFGGPLLPALGLHPPGEEIHEQSHRLDHELATTHHEIETRRTVADDVAAGRLSLADATDVFLTLNEARPDRLPLVRERFPGCPDRECAARQVIATVRHRARTPAARDAADWRLGGEFAALFPDASPLSPWPALP